MTIIPFAPSDNAAPPFAVSVTLDNVTYSLTAAWNIYRGDWYITLADQSGNILITQPLIGSPPGSNIYLAPSCFQTSTLVYRVATGNFEIGP